MTGKSFFNGVIHGKKDILERFLSTLDDAKAPYCVIGGLAVNAYVEPVVSLDLDVVIAAGDLTVICQEAEKAGLSVEHFEHSINLASPDSDLRIQLQTDARYQDFIARAVQQEVLGYHMWVACLEDVAHGKTWAYLDEARRKSKRLKDLSDIMRLVEAHPKLRCLLPESIQNQIA